MNRGVVYDDGRAVLDDEGVTLRYYYFPLGSSKRIPYRRIRGVEIRPMGWLTGKGRGWGTSDPRYWLPLDLGGFVQPAFSPEEPDRVLEIVRQRI